MPGVWREWQRLLGGFDEQRQHGAGREERVEHRGGQRTGAPCYWLPFPLGKGEDVGGFGQALRGDSRNRGR